MGTETRDDVLPRVLSVFAAVIVRWAVSLHGYSGYGKAPMFGDYEAQRHWMEITVNLPIDSWYRNSTDNDLLYWGLDYPPLTAYHSYFNGKLAESINSSWNALHASRGLEDQIHKIFMRFTVIASDLFLYIPLIVVFYLKNKSFVGNISENCLSLSFLCALMDPGLTLIDHGHFQYNSVSLGLALWAVYAISHQRPFTASALFCLALNYKQMELYHSIPFFIYLLKQCYQQKNIFSQFLMLVKLGLVVVITFLFAWAPFLLSSDYEGLMQIVRRIFPFNRGLFEDKVGNIWCSLQPILRLKEVTNQSRIVSMCLTTTVLSLLPDVYLLWRSATPRNLLLALVSTSLSFFLCSYHVHEKSILLATAPASLLLLHHPRIMGWFMVIATGSMFPLLHKDGLTLPVLSLSLLFLLLLHMLIDERSGDDPVVMVTDKLRLRAFHVSVLATLSVFGMVVLCGLHLAVTPPPRYPDLFTYLIAVYSCAHFLFFKICALIFMGSDKLGKID